MSRRMISLGLALSIAIVVSWGGISATLAQTPYPDGAGRNCAHIKGPAFLVTADGLKDRSGRAILELYPANEADFLKKKEALLSEGKLFRQVEAPVPRQGPVNLCIDAPRPGAYALVFIHDRDGKRTFNIWKDGVGLVTGQPLGTSRPRVSQAMVVAGNSPAHVPMQVQYMSGMAGFSPQHF
ncbi:DUF2141 domain-containing protein [Sphingobium sp. H39-3-25]|uniref:DUF2141 domain-containing protein n=1 Tax=Sphingobium arseniciresistens TaxID=3030834 RepID=UPI0023B992BE|nr:DUF2141 domain-containing protein [Sphingobium arseniciresistens]